MNEFDRAAKRSRTRLRKSAIAAATLAKAIDLAIVGGWDYGTVRYLVPAADIRSEKYAALYIFNHDFARCLWGTETAFTLPSDADEPGIHELEQHGEMWQYHLQMMVIDPDPLQYLANHLPEVVVTA